MDEITVQTMARSLMDEHGLDHIPFEFDRAKRSLGTTKFRTQFGVTEPFVITFSRVYVPLVDEDVVRDTILHEVAHAIAGFHAGHGPVWKMWAKRVGANPSRVAHDAPVLEKKYKGVCPNGHDCGGFHRLPRRIRSCSKCYRGSFKLDYLITYSENGRPISEWDMPAGWRSELARTRG